MTLQPWLACTSLCLCVREHKTFVSLRIHAFIHPCVWQWNPHLFSVVFVNTVPGWAAGQTYRLISALGLVYKTTAGRREDCCLHHDNSTSLCLVFKNSRHLIFAVSMSSRRHGRDISHVHLWWGKINSKMENVPLCKTLQKNRIRI